MRDVPSGSPAAGLEVDSRPVDQSEKIANGGHMTPAHEGPVPSYSEPTAWHPASTAPFAGSDYSENKVPTQKSNRAGLGGAVLWLSVALAIALILAVVAAGVGGSLAASRKEKLSSCTANNEALQHKVSTGCADTSLASSNYTSGNNSTCNLSSKPTSDCASFPATYTSYDSSVYNITCNQDLKTGSIGPDIMGIFVRSLRDCMEACTSFNDKLHATNGTCYSVTVNWNIDPVKGNCWLKAYTDIPTQGETGVDSAVITKF